MVNIDQYMRMKLIEFNDVFTMNDQYVLYEYLYADFNGDYFKELLSRMHSALCKLMKFMNEKHNTFNGGHYNAAESRELIFYIDFYKLLKANLLKQGLEISIDKYYVKRFEDFTVFLSASGGSPIPKDFEKVKIIDSKPIFFLSNQVVVENRTITLALKYIGEGSYAKVYKYRDPNTKQWIVIKKSNSDLNADELIRFRLEFDSITRLDSPFIIKAYGYNEEENSYSMEFMDEDLDTYISKRNNKLAIEKRKILIVQILNGFRYLHSKEMLHRDISYNNLLVKTYDDGTDMIKISDLGLVKIKDSKLTNDRTLIKGSINDLTDLERVGFSNYSIYHETYALTKIIYYILTGKKSNFEREKNVVLKEFLGKGLHPQRDSRFNSIEEIKDFLNSKIYPNLNRDVQRV